MHLAEVPTAIHKDTAAKPAAKPSARPTAKPVAAKPKPAVTAAQVLSLAESQSGAGPDASGDTTYGTWYGTYAKAHGDPQWSDYASDEWCDAFVSWVGNRLGITSTVGSFAFTQYHAQWFVSQNHWGHTPKPGAVVFFSWDGGNSITDIAHVGFVIKDNGDGTITTIEGNTSNTVAQRVRPQSEVVGYGYPSYITGSSS